MEELVSDDFISDDELRILPENFVHFFFEIGLIDLVIVVANQEYIVTIVGLLIMWVTKVKGTVHFHI